jgi:hypothetical protein
LRGGAHATVEPHRQSLEPGREDRPGVAAERHALTVAVRGLVCLGHAVGRHRMECCMVEHDRAFRSC